MLSTGLAVYESIDFDRLWACSEVAKLNRLCVIHLVYLVEMARVVSSVVLVRSGITLMLNTGLAAYYESADFDKSWLRTKNGTVYSGLTCGA